MVKDTGKTIYVGNLNYKRDEKGIKALFSRFGRIQFIQLITDPKSGKKKGYAFVKMQRSKDALAAIEELNGREVDGRTLKVSEAIENGEDREISPRTTKVEKREPSKKDVPKKRVRKEKKGGLQDLFNYLKK